MLEELNNQISDKFVDAVEAIADASGKCVLSGIGKSAIIAQKICATFNSIGITSVFLHGADALHGDMGVVSDGDIVICFSKSGETEELIDFGKYVSQRKIKIIALSSNSSSSLAKIAHIHLFIPAIKEADSYDIIPTSSTTAQLAMGDALAMALMQVKGTSLSSLSRVHPHGTIGRKLLLSVKSLLQKNSNPFVGIDDLLMDVIMSMTTHRLGATVVLNDKKIEGIITDGDLRRMLQSVDNPKGVTAVRIMTHNPICIDSDMKAYAALKLMEDRSITQLIVMENGQYSGLIHIHDIVKAGIR